MLSSLKWLPGSLCVVKGRRIPASEECLESLLGYNPGELWGSDRHQIISPSEFNRVRAAVGTRGDGHCITRYTTKQKTQVDVELFTHALPVNGESILLVSSLENANARNRAEIFRLEHLITQSQKLGMTGVWSLDLETNVLFWDEGTRRLHELPDDFQPAVETAINFYHPGDRAAKSSAVEACMHNGRAYDLQLRIMTALGKERWVRTMGEARYTGNQIASLFGVIQDITEIMHSREAKKQSETIRSAIIAGTSNFIGEDFLESLVKNLARATSTKCVLIAKIDIQRELASTIAICIDGEIVENIEYGLTGTPCQDIVNKRDCLYANDVQKRYPGDIQLRELNAESYAGSPLIGTDGDILGLLILIDDNPVKDEELVQSIFSLFSGLASAELERILVQDRFTGALKRTVAALAATIGQRDSYTAQHQRNVSKIATEIAEDMKLDPERINAIAIASSIHDIGKISIPADILTKPGKLNELEYALVKTHSERGYDILKDMELPWGIAEMVLQHHERLDGSGYPAGLKDREISLGARIIAVADVADAMTSHRPDRPALTFEKAREELENDSGSLYDPKVVSAYLRVHDHPIG